MPEFVSKKPYPYDPYGSTVDRDEVDAMLRSEFDGGWALFKYRVRWYYSHLIGRRIRAVVRFFREDSPAKQLERDILARRLRKSFAKPRESKGNC